MKRYSKGMKKLGAALLAALLLALAWPISALAETPDIPAQNQEGDITPAEGGDNPTEGEGTPTEGEGNPTEGEGNPTEGEGNPSEGEGNPTEGEGNPSEGEGNPAEDEGNPAEGEGNPAEGEGNPAEGEDTPTEGAMATMLQSGTPERLLYVDVPSAECPDLRTAISKIRDQGDIRIREPISISYSDFDAMLESKLMPRIIGNGNTITVTDQKKVNNSNCGIHINGIVKLHDIVFKSAAPSDYFITISSGAEGSFLSNITVESIAEGGMSSALHVRDVENITINGFTVGEEVKTSNENIGCVTVSGANNCKIDGLTILSKSPGVRFETNPKNNTVAFSNVSIPNSSAPVTSANSSITNNGSSIALVEGFDIGLDLLNSGNFSPTVFFPTVADVYKHNRFGPIFGSRMNASIADINRPGVFYAFYKNDAQGNTVMLNNKDIPSGSLVKLVLTDGATEFDGDIKFNNSRELTIQAVLLDDLDATGDQIKFNGNEIVNSALPNNTTLQNFDFTPLGWRHDKFCNETGFNAPEGTTNTTNTFFAPSVSYLPGADEDAVANMPDPATLIHDRGDSIDMSSAVPTRTGYNFTGWKCSIDGAVYAAGQADAFVMPATSITLTAQWEMRQTIVVPEETPTPTPIPEPTPEPSVTPTQSPTTEPDTQPTATPTPSREPITVSTQEPTPAPENTPVPVVSTPPQEGGGTTSDEGETTPTNVSPVVQEQLEAQKDHTLIENILNNNVPLGNFAFSGAWGLLNLIITLASIVLGIVNVIRWVVKRRKLQYTSDGEAIVSQRYENIMLVLRGISVACGLLVGLAFLLLENLAMPVAFINAYTPLFILLGLLQPLILLGAWIVRRRRDRAEEQLLQEAEAENGMITGEDLRQWVPQSMDH